MTDPGVVLASELQPGTYVCLRTRSLFGWAVRAFTRSPYDHAVLVTAPGGIVQATVRGVKVGLLSQFRGCVAVANSAEPIAEDARLAIATKGLSYVGDEYAFPLVLVTGLRKLGLSWPWLVRVCQDNDAVFCSELVCLAGTATSPAQPWLCGEPSAATVRPDEMADRSPFMRAVVWDG
jgi:hypothetical protein